MKNTATLIAVAALVLTGYIGIVGADEPRTLKGEFVWNHRDSAVDLEAVFTPTGENRWDVAFHFEFRGKPHTYSGTAEGSLTDGGLSGKVRNENKKRTFTFKGKFKNEVFTGAHAETTDGRAQSTGTLTLGGLTPPTAANLPIGLPCSAANASARRC